MNFVPKCVARDINKPRSDGDIAYDKASSSQVSPRATRAGETDTSQTEAKDHCTLSPVSTHPPLVFILLDPEGGKEAFVGFTKRNKNHRCHCMQWNRRTARARFTALHAAKAEDDEITQAHYKALKKIDLEDQRPPFPT